MRPLPRKTPLRLLAPPPRAAYPGPARPEHRLACLSQRSCYRGGRVTGWAAEPEGPIRGISITGALSSFPLKTLPRSALTSWAGDAKAVNAVAGEQGASAWEKQS